MSSAPLSCLRESRFESEFRSRTSLHLTGTWTCHRTRTTWHATEILGFGAAMGSGRSRNSRLAGGHVAAEVIADVLDSIGYELYYPETCSPECKFMFMHTALHVREDSQLVMPLVDLENDEEPSWRPFGCRNSVSPARDVRNIAILLSLVVSDFAEFKNLGRRLIDVEHLCRLDLAHVLSHVYEHSQLVAEGHSPAVLKRRWESRSWQQEVRGLVAAIWLDMANMETLHRNWEEYPGRRGRRG